MEKLQGGQEKCCSSCVKEIDYNSIYRYGVLAVLHSLNRLYCTLSKVSISKIVYNLEWVAPPNASAIWEEFLHLRMRSGFLIPALNRLQVYPLKPSEIVSAGPHLFHDVSVSLALWQPKGQVSSHTQFHSRHIFSSVAILPKKSLKRVLNNQNKP